MPGTTIKTLLTEMQKANHAVIDKVLHALSHEDKIQLAHYLRGAGQYQLEKRLQQAIDEGW